MLAETSTRRQRTLSSLSLLAILLLAALLRCYRLDAQSLWNDEGTSVQLALRGLSAITRDAAADIHPPLYYYLLHFWVGLFGTSEWAVRSLSALLGILTVGLTYGLCRPLGRGTALLAALLAAISPLCVYYSQETRMYMLLACVATASTWALAPLTPDAKPRWRELSLYAALGSALIYAHYMGFAVLLAHNLAWLATWIAQRGQTGRSRWQALSRWALLQAFILLSYVPWLLTSWSSLSGWPAVREPLRLSELLSEALQVLPFGVTMPFSRSTLLIGTALAAMAASALLPPHETASADDDSGRRSTLWRLVLAAIVPIAVIYLLSLSRPMYKQKFLIVCAPFYAALLAHGAITLHARFRARCQRRWLPNLLGALLLVLPVGASALSLNHLYYDAAYRRDDYRGIVAYIQATAGPADPILINAPSQIETVSYYHQGPQPLVPLPLQRPLDQAKTEAALEQLLADSERIYAIFWATDESDPEGFIETWLTTRCYQAMDSWFGNLRLVVYAVPATQGEGDRVPLGIAFGEGIRLEGYALLTPATDSGDILQLGLTWQALTEIPTRYKVFVHLLDERGAIVSQRDSEPLGGQRPTTSWAVDEVIEDAHGLWVRPGTPPGEHTLRVGLYDAASGTRLVVTSSESEAATGMDAVDLGTVTIASPSTPPPTSALDMENVAQLDWGGLTLLGHSLHKLGFAHAPETPLRPGDLVELILFWQRSAGAPPEAYRLSLSQGRDQVWAQEYAILGERYSPWGWAMGETLREVQTIGLPGDIPPGRYDLLIEPLSGDTSAERLQRLTLSP